ncbi:MAG: hypothetical protein RL610_1255 [Pseudomonadota bacterium]|jgi:hypothetical protein
MRETITAVVKVRFGFFLMQAEDDGTYSVDPL